MVMWPLWLVCYHQEVRMEMLLKLRLINPMEWPLMTWAICMWLTTTQIWSAKSLGFQRRSNSKSILLMLLATRPPEARSPKVMVSGWILKVRYFLTSASFPTMTMWVGGERGTISPWVSPPMKRSRLRIWQISVSSALQTWSSPAWMTTIPAGRWWELWIRMLFPEWGAREAQVMLILASVSPTRQATQALRWQMQLEVKELLSMWKPR